MSRPPVSILISEAPTERGKKYTELCVKSIELHTDQERTPFEILVSSTGHHTQSVNDLARKAKNELLVFMCNDMVMHRGWLEEFHNVWELLEKNGKKVGQLTGFITGGPMCIGGFQDVRRNTYSDGRVIPCPRVVWTTNMISKKSFMDIGMMDERFKGAGSYMDDDISLRFIKSGYENFVFSTVLLHFGQGSHIDSGGMGKDFEDGKIAFEEKWKKTSIEIFDTYLKKGKLIV